MSEKSGITAQIILLPKGGGAWYGIGVKFSPDLHTGTGNFTIPITLPLGRNGFQPQLNLAYSPGNDHGYFGPGWGRLLTLPCPNQKTQLLRAIQKQLNALRRIIETVNGQLMAELKCRTALWLSRTISGCWQDIFSL